MKFSRMTQRNKSEIRSNSPLSEAQILEVAPSIFSEDKHGSRSDRYTHIPTIDVLRGLKKQGFQPFMVCQAKARDEGKHQFAKHMIRLRHAEQISQGEAQEIILLNSHDGASSYQMLSGAFRFVCSNGLVCGDMQNDIRIKHQGDVLDNVIEGAFRVLQDFETSDAQIDGMKSLTLNTGEANAFAHAALALRYDDETKPAPITEAQILRPRRAEDTGTDLWTTFNVVQESFMRGGLRSRSANGRKATTREISGIGQSLSLNRALWTLADEMRKLKAA